MAKRIKEDPYDLCTCYEPSEPTPEEFIFQDSGTKPPPLGGNCFKQHLLIEG